MRAILAAAGAASIAAMSVIPPADVTLTANVLTVTGYTAGGILNWDMNDIFRGAFCTSASGNSCSEVPYLSGIPYLGEADGVRALTSALRSVTSPTTVLGFSQGSLVASYWLRTNAGRPGAPDPENLSFVLAANPLRKYGGSRSAAGLDRPTPDTEYKVLDIAIEYDGAADFPDNPFNLLAVANAMAGFQYIHIFGYDDIDLGTVEKMVWTDGNTTYVLVRSETIPLLQPLRTLGLNDLADRLNDPLKQIIDTAYKRNYPNVVAPEDQDEVLAQFPSAPKKPPNYALSEPQALRTVSGHTPSGAETDGGLEDVDNDNSANADTSDAVSGTDDRQPTRGEEPAEPAVEPDTGDIPAGVDDESDAAADDLEAARDMSNPIESIRGYQGRHRAEEKPVASRPATGDTPEAGTDSSTANTASSTVSQHSAQD